MSTIKVIVERMISEPDFANAVLADAETAVAEYDLSADEVVKLKGLSRAQFEALTPEERKSMSFGSMETMKKAWKDS